MADEITIALLRGILPQRPAEGHKGTFGHLFVIAGSRGFTGAAKLACEAAARSGVGLVTVGVPRPLGDIVASSLTETMSFMLPSTGSETLSRAAVEPALEFAATKEAVALGPGLSQHTETQAFVLEFVQRCPVPMLIDADGLNALSAKPGVLLERRAPCVLTPHPSEMARLVGKKTADVQAAREGIALDVASRYNCAVVLKGHRTVVADASGEAYVNPTGNSGLAKGGTGDVLSGLIGGLMAQGLKPFHAALLGVYMHGLAADIAAREKTERAMTATDVVRSLPAAWKVIEQEA